MDSVKGGNPVLDGVFAWLDCSIWAEHDSGNHLIILGRVLQLGASEKKPVPDPLLYFQGQYRAVLRPSAHNYHPSGKPVTVAPTLLQERRHPLAAAFPPHKH